METSGGLRACPWSEGLGRTQGWLLPAPPCIRPSALLFTLLSTPTFPSPGDLVILASDRWQEGVWTEVPLSFWKWGFEHVVPSPTREASSRHRLFCPCALCVGRIPGLGGFDKGEPELVTGPG